MELKKSPFEVRSSIHFSGGETILQQSCLLDLFPAWRFTSVGGVSSTFLSFTGWRSCAETKVQFLQTYPYPSWNLNIVMDNLPIHKSRCILAKWKIISMAKQLDSWTLSHLEALKQITYLIVTHCISCHGNIRVPPNAISLSLIDPLISPYFVEEVASPHLHIDLGESLEVKKD